MIPVIQEWLYAREVARRLGFTPEELYFSVHSSGKEVIAPGPVIKDHGGPLVSLVIKAQGLEFTWIIGAAIGVPYGDLEGIYRTACDEWNTKEGAEHEVGFRQSNAYSKRVQLVRALVTKGFVVRR